MEPGAEARRRGGDLRGAGEGPVYRGAHAEAGDGVRGGSEGGGGQGSLGSLGGIFCRRGFEEDELDDGGRGGGGVSWVNLYFSYIFSYVRAILFFRVVFFVLFFAAEAAAGAAVTTAAAMVVVVVVVVVAAAAPPIVVRESTTRSPSFRVEPWAPPRSDRLGVLRYL